jgi:tartrate/fumarate subfamily iron-sulfur-dependent hydro-lyase alpha chain
MRRLCGKRPCRAFHDGHRPVSAMPLPSGIATVSVGWNTGPAEIKQEDLIQSVADALQFISYYHPVDFIQAMHEAYEREESPAAKDAMAQILINSRMCAEGHRPICQDTGIVTVFVKVGMNVRWDGDAELDDMINEGVRRAYNHPDNVLRASILADPAGQAQEHQGQHAGRDHMEHRAGRHVDVIVAAKGGGSENKSKIAMLNPSDSIVDWVLKTVPTMGAGWCPPGMLGIGIGGTAEKAMLLAKESLMDPIDIHDLIERGPQEPRRGTAHRAVRQGQRARHRRAGPRRPDHRARREDPGLPDPRGEPAGGDDPELRRHAPCALRARRLRPALRSSRRRSTTGRHDLGGGRCAAREPRYRHARGSRDVEDRRNAAAERQDADRARRRAQAHDRHARRASRCRSTWRIASSTTSARSIRCATKWWARRARPPRRAWTSSPHDAREDRPDRHDRQVRARPVAIEAIRDNQAVYLMAVGGAAYLVSKAITAARSWPSRSSAWKRSTSSR